MLVSKAHATVRWRCVQLRPGCSKQQPRQFAAQGYSPGVAKMLAGISTVTSRSAAVSRSMGSAVAAGVCLGVLATCTCKQTSACGELSICL